MRRMSRRSFLSSSAAALAAVGLAGCASNGPSGLVTTGTRLRVLNWPEYIDPDLLNAADLRSLSVTYEELWEDNTSGAALFGPEWDIVTPTNWLAAQLIQEGRVQRLPVEWIPNHANIDPVFLTNGWDRGARFHMPWQSGITGIAYDPALTGRELTSVNDLFAPDLAGRVAMIGEMREAVGLTMLLAGDDPARPTEAKAERAFDKLAEFNASGQFYKDWVFNDFADLLKTGTVAASMAWSGDAVQMQRERPDLKFVIPEEGAIQWFDTMVIPTGASNARGAAQWMNHFYDPEVAARNTEFIQYISPVLGVREVLESRGGFAADIARNPILFPDDEIQRRLFIWGGLESTSDEQELDDRFAALAGL